MDLLMFFRECVSVADENCCLFQAGGLGALEAFKVWD